MIIYLLLWIEGWMDGWMYECALVFFNTISNHQCGGNNKPTFNLFNLQGII